MLGGLGLLVLIAAFINFSAISRLPDLMEEERPDK